MAPTSPVAGTMPTIRTGYRAGPALVWWLLAAVLVGVVGWIKTINVLLLVSYTLAALLAINAFLAHRMTRRITARRIPHAPAFAGEEIVLHAEFINPDSRAKSLSLAEASASGVAAVWYAPHFDAGSTVPASSRVTFLTRGRHPLPPLVARSGYPLGILAFQRTLTAASEQLVLPPLGTVNARSLKRFLIRAGHGDDRSRRPPARWMPSDGDVRGLRPHRTGDGVRDIHWKTSARRGKWMVREYDQTAPIDLTIFVDPWVPSGPTDPTSQRKLEWALSFALSAAWAWVHEESPGTIALVVCEATISVQSGPGTPRFIREGFFKLAEVTGTSDVDATALQSLPALRHKATRLVVSTRPRGPVAGAIRAAGLSLAVVDPSTPIHWFAPPGAAALIPLTGKRDAP